MNPSLVRKSVALLMAVMLAAPFSYAGQLASGQQSENSSSASGTSQQSEPSLEARPLTSPGQTANPGQDQMPADNKPVGTATAPYEKASGVTATRPAGAVIAPAKQRRVRTILIRISIVAGAAAAVGAVAALSHSSPSRP